MSRLAVILLEEIRLAADRALARLRSEESPTTADESLRFVSVEDLSRPGEWDRIARSQAGTAEDFARELRRMGAVRRQAWPSGAADRSRSAQSPDEKR